MNPILQKVEQAALAKVNPPQLAQAVNKMVGMGKHLLYSPNAQKLVKEELSSSASIPDAIGEGVARILGMIIHASKGTLPPKVAIPTATILMCEVIDLLEQAGKAQVTNQFVGECAKSLSSALMQLFGATPEKLQSLFNKAKQPGAQPEQPAQPAQQPAGGLIQSAKGVAA